MKIDSTPHASPGFGEADHAGSCFSPPKTPLSAEELVEHLRNKGLSQIENHSLMALLNSVGYYRLRGYWLTLESNHRFLPGTTSDHIVRIVDFDRDICLFVFKCIRIIEVKLRAQMSAALSEQYGINALHLPLAFKDPDQFELMQDVISRETLQALRTRKPFAIHNAAKYGRLPIWAEVENTSFGTLSKAYGNLSDLKLAMTIARSFGIPRSHLKNWLRYINQIRNICAHHDRLYNKLFSIRPRLFSEHQNVDKARLFPVFIILFRLLESADGKTAFKARIELDKIIAKYPSVDLAPVGFPKDWKSILKIPQPVNQNGPRARGRNGGRPAKNQEAIEYALHLYDSKKHSIAEISSKTGVSSSTLYKYIKLR